MCACVILKAAWIDTKLGPMIAIADKELTDYFNGEQCQFEAPLILIGSPFQKSVWNALRKIPPGETRSYLNIASVIKKATAFRAVANANGANQLAIIIPCHRVINANGDSGGISRKQWLIDHEKKYYLTIKREKF